VIGLDQNRWGIATTIDIQFGPINSAFQVQ
jgi:hypothetical protein